MDRLVFALFACAGLTAAAFAEAQPDEQDATPDPAAPGATEPTGEPEGPAAGDEPPPYYYTEPPLAEPSPAPGAEAGAPGRVPRSGPARRPDGVAYEPPPPGMAYPVVLEPPPPPRPQHLAPKSALWLGARLGYFIPFGNLWARCTVADIYGNCMAARGIGFSDYASPGPVGELDVGARLGRRYNLLFTWERAELGGGSDAPPELPSSPPDSLSSKRASSDYYAFGFRFSSDPDDVGFLTEFALGYRQLTVVWDDGTELKLSDAPFEFRLGLGADIRLSENFALSPLFTIGFGGFGDADWVLADGSGESARTPADFTDTHGWFTLQLGAHFDLAGSG